eukprot:GFUD01033267.1.p1 GENE.GFUD01033267.1~~GFUD01033267.1.p1  ORF type:complete len:380 (-),score=88.80 GFUD01033267.1:71-1210(-)
MSNQDQDYSSFTSSSSSAVAWKLPVGEWSNLTEEECIVLPLSNLFPLGNTAVLFGLDVYPQKKKNSDKITVVLFFVESATNPESELSQFQIETAYRIRKPSDSKPLEMYRSRSYETFHSSELDSTDVFGGKVSGTRFLSSIYDVGTVEERCEDGFIIFESAIRIVSNPEKKFQASFSKQNQIILKNFESFYGTPGDVKIVCGGKEFSCHKLLLTAQSPVFRAMFAHDSKESAESSVPIDDSTPEAVHEFLFFLYHGMMRIVPFTSADLELVFGLVHLASKYQMNVLVDICKDVLVDIVDVFSVLKIMVVVDKYPELSEVTVRLGNFMKENFEEIVKNEDWSEFVVTNPSLVTDFLLTMKKEMVGIKKACDRKLKVAGVL